ncbi:MAG: hypothetical protein ACOX5R_05610 [bacterium]|jgi:hypothetical protein
MHVNHFLSHSLLLVLSFTLSAAAQDKTTFQTASPWSPEIDLRSDVAIVYGVNDSFSARVKSWRERGYGIHMMTGVAWGGYQDYINGDFDGTNHMDEGQVQQSGEMIMHNPGVPYMVPSTSYIEYLKSKIKAAIDEGVSAIHLEEPEFWNRGGYSEGFKREWQSYYNEPWQAQHSSPDATYRSAKLKYHLYFRALKELFLFAKEYSEQQGRRVECYVPTHTLINYSAWGIVSPESSLSDLPGMDGYIAQVWTGTARTPTYYQGIEKERTFENAFLEYGSMLAMTQPTGRRVYFLTDPIEDNPNHTWEDYKKNYEATFTAQILYPSVAHYEVMPWPDRIFRGSYRREGTNERHGIPSDYATQILVMINALNQMESDDTSLPGTQGIGVLLSDTMMFQRFPTHAGYEDPRLSNFYGMAMPLVKQGIPINLVQMENLLQPDTLKNIRILLMSYANMKPLNPEYHAALIEWLKQGNALIYLGRDLDPFQNVREWWNQDEQNYSAPAQHLFELAGITDNVPQDETRTFPVGKGFLTISRIDPKEIVMERPQPVNPETLITSLMEKMKAAKSAPPDWNYTPKNHFHLQRGAFDVVAVLDESASGLPYRVEAPGIDLFDPTLPVRDGKVLQPDERALLLNLNRIAKDHPQVLASASRVSDENIQPDSYSFTMKSPSGTQGVARLWLPRQPKNIKASLPDKTDVELQSEWHSATSTLLLRYPNHPDGVQFNIEFQDMAKDTMK